MTSAVTKIAFSGRSWRGIQGAAYLISNQIYLEQSDEIFYTFLHVDTRNLELIEIYCVGCDQKWLWDTDHKVNG